MSTEEAKTETPKVDPAPAPEVIAAAAAAAANSVEMEVASPTPTPGRVSLLNDVDGQGKRRFFPRVKHLIGNKEWEDFLTQVLQCIEEAGAPETAAASHKANNAWYKAFDLIYGGVAREYSIPTGKNRYHKFKDKILEVWVALEAQAPGENHCRELAMEQYDRYKRTCAEASKNGSAVTPNKALKTAAGQSSKLAGGKRSYSTAMGGGSILSTNNSTYLWKNLDESAQLAKLPTKLQKLVHLKQLSKEMTALTSNRPSRKGVEEHSKKLDAAYLEALTEYLGPSSAEDVEMTTDDETKTSETEAYEQSLVVAFLYRYASTLQEQKMLSDAYAKATAKCVTFPVEAEEPEAPPPAAVTDEAAAVAATAAAAAIEEGFAPVQI